jgi:hypothetical protein
LQFSKEELALAKREDKGPLRAWVALDNKGKDGERRIHARLFQIDEPSRSAVMCLMMLSGRNLDLFEEYKQACDTLMVRPANFTPLPTKPIPARRSAAEAALAPSARDKAIGEVALGFLQAVVKRDEKAAATYLPSATLCEKEKDAAKKKRCVEELGTLRKALGQVIKGFPKDFQGGAVDYEEIKPGLLAVHVRPKGDDCGEGQRFMIFEQPDGKRSVVFAMRKE